MTGRELHVIVPGSLEQRTGGTIYDRRIVEGLRRRSWTVTVHGLHGVFPIADARARSGLAAVLAQLPDAAHVLIDGLAMSGSPGLVRAHAGRLRMLALVHLPLADEPGLTASQVERRTELEKDALACMDGVIVSSPSSATRLAAMGVAPAVVRTVLPGTERAVPATGPGIGTPPQLLCVGAVTPGKGQDVLVRALARIVDTPWRCICAGSLERSAAFAGRVQAQARDAGLEGRVEFRGECDDSTLDMLYRTSSVFVLPSRYESYGMALTEAMARGLPVVSTTAGAIPETVPAAAGILVAPGDDMALADALRYLLIDAPDEPDRARARRAQLGAAARRYVDSLPDWDTAVDAFEAALAALLVESGSAGSPRQGAPID